MPQNKAAWQVKVGEPPMVVKEALYTSPTPEQIIIKAGAWAINPADNILQLKAIIPNGTYPMVLGFDVAGEVVEVGSDVKRFKLGDRVLGMALGVAYNKDQEGAFQHYVALHHVVTSHIPDSLSYAEASVFPSTAATAACALFEKDHLALQYPSVTPQPNGQTVVIWGGSSCVGCNAIQMAVAAGYEVVTTTSPKNFDLVKRLGAKHVIDYTVDTAIDDVVAAANASNLVGIVQAAGDAATCLELGSRVKGDVFVSTVLPTPEPSPFPQVRTKFIWCASLRDNEVGPAIYERFLEPALAAGTYKVAPKPVVVGKGLGSLQQAMDRLREGVSAEKMVVVAG